LEGVSSALAGVTMDADSPMAKLGLLAINSATKISEVNHAVTNAQFRYLCIMVIPELN
jgi:hypothetical protein